MDGSQRRGIALHKRNNQGTRRKQVCTWEFLEGVIISERAIAETNCTKRIRSFTLER